MLVWRRRVRKHYISVGTTFSFMRMADIRVMRSECRLTALQVDCGSWGYCGANEPSLL